MLKFGIPCLGGGGGGTYPGIPFGGGGGGTYPGIPFLSGGGPGTYASTMR